MRFALAAAAAVGMAVAGATPATAASASGSINCTNAYVSYVTLSIYPSTSGGTGSWQNRNTGAGLYFSFPGGRSKRTTSWLSVNWTVTNPGFFWETPSARCGG